MAKLKKPATKAAKKMSRPKASAKRLRVAPPPRSRPATRQAIHIELGEQLGEVRGDEARERVAFASAIDAFMQLELAGGAVADGSLSAVVCPAFFWEGDGANPPVWGRVADATHDEISRWFQILVEESRAWSRAATA